MPQTELQTTPRGEDHITPKTAAAPRAARPEIHIRPFEPRDTGAFRALNEAWINTLFGMEDEDGRILTDPIHYVLEPGGHIFIAETDSRTIGCCALVLMRPGVYEVAKMAVSEELRGHGIGRLILEHVITRARDLGAHELELATNTRLANAVHLYESLGFQHLPPERVTPSPFARANVYMEMHL